MSGIGSGYDYSVATFSPDGKVFQTEYAQKAVDNSTTAIGLRCKDGVLLATEKPVASKLLVANSDKRIHAAAKHVGLVTCGFPADGRQVVNRAVDECSNYKECGSVTDEFYGEEMPGHVLAERVGAYLHLFNLYGYLRPYGTAHLMAAKDNFNGHALFLLETSGIVHKFYGTAVGKHRQAAKTEIEKLDLSSMTCREAVQRIVKMFLANRDDQKDHEIEMGWLTEETGWTYKVVPLDLIKQAEAAAAAFLDDAGMDED